MRRGERSTLEQRYRAMLWVIAVIHLVTLMLMTRPGVETAPGDASSETRCVIFAA